MGSLEATVVTEKSFINTAYRLKVWTPNSYCSIPSNVQHGIHNVLNYMFREDFRPLLNMAKARHKKLPRRYTRQLLRRTTCYITPVHFNRDWEKLEFYIVAKESSEQ